MNLGVPDGIRGCLLDLDGVLTKTAAVHDAAWKEMFDSYLSERARQTGQPFVPFDPAADYDEYVDGKPRADGVRSFLAARGIKLPEGSQRLPEAETVNGLGNRKNEILLRRIRCAGVAAYQGSVRYARAVQAAGRAGQFGYLVGVDRAGQADALQGARRRHRGDRPRRPAGPAVIRQGVFTVEPWCLRETALDLDLLAQAESVFALVERAPGLARPTWTRASRTACRAAT